jgi:glycosyltransferase involved in cell wall biosynthesis
MTVPADIRLRGVLVCSTFPAPLLPNQGLINLTHLKALAPYFEFKVLVPHRYFPGKGDNRFHPAVGSHRQDDGISITDIRTWYLPFFRGPINARLYSRCIRTDLERLCATFRPHFLMTSWGFPDAVGVGREAKRLGLPLVAILRGTDVHLYSQMPARWRAMITTFNQAAMVIPISQALATPVLNSGVNPERVQVIHYGVDQTTFCIRNRNEVATELDLPTDRKRILFVGNLVPVKDIPTLLKAFALLIHDGNRDTDLFLIGDGPGREEAEKQIAHHNLRGRVNLLGEKLHGEVARWISACDVVCLSSLNEGIPNVILEALACGRPVVSSRVGGIPEVICEGKTGLLVPPRESRALAQALASVLAKEWDAAYLRRSVAAFDWDTNARTFAQLFQRIAA